MNNKTNNGYITQNGHWISLKTRIYSERIALFQSLADELDLFLVKANISHSGEFCMEKSANSMFRKGCVTIRVSSSDEKMKALPFESDANN